MACSSLPVDLLSRRQKVIDELVQGREVANHLHTILSLSDGDDDESVVTSEKDLASRIMESFTNSLSMVMNKNDTYNEAVVGSKIQAAATSYGVDSPTYCLDARKSKNFQESFRSVSSNLKENRRGCYKRRKTAADSTWESETSTLTDDGRAWRKYGQKMIHKTKHPRSYYRCTHKNDQGCQATKQVQQTGDNPPMFRTTYYGHHTCRDLQTAPEIVLDSTSPGRDSSRSFLISFNKSNLNLTSKEAHPFHPPFEPAKEEFFNDEKVVPCNYDNNNMTVANNMSQTSTSDYTVSDDDLEYLMMAFDQSPRHMTVLSSNYLDCDHIHGDVISGMMSLDDDFFRN